MIKNTVKSVIYQWRIQDFPLGGGAPTHWGGRQPSMRTLFGENIGRKQKKLILLGGRAPRRPPGSANGDLRSVLDGHLACKASL